MTDMKDAALDSFQYTVAEMLVRNKSILDSMTKLDDSNARINRAVSKAVTQCGCVSICASKQDYQEDQDFDTVRDLMKTHMDGQLCPTCRDIVEKEIGRHLFYLTSMMNTLDLNLYDVLIKELDRVRLLGKFSLR